MGKLFAGSAAWTVILLPIGLFGLIGALKVMLWTFDVGNFITGQGPPPWPF